MIETRALNAERAGKPSGGGTYQSVILILLPFLILASFYMKLLLQTIFVRNDVTHPEGSNVYAFLWSLRTGKLYTSPFDFPFNTQLYGPIFYLIGLGFAKLAHGDPLLTLRLWRAVSFLSFLGCAGVIGYLSWKLESAKRWAAASVVLSLACAWAVPFAASVRADLLSAFLILAALAVYVSARGRSRLVFWAGVLGAVSCLTKQSTAPVLFALLVDTLLARRFRNTAALIAGCVPLPAILLSALWLRHEPFLENFLAIRHAPVEWSGAFHFLVDVLRTNQIAVIPAFIALLGAGLSWRKERYRAILLAAVFGCLSNVGALTSTGGYSNYLILPWMLSVLLVPAGLAGIEVWARRSVLIPLGLTLLGGFLLIHQWNLLPELPADLNTSGVDKIRMLTDTHYLELFSREPQLLDPIFYHQLFAENVWSFAPIVQQIDREEYDLILLWGSDGPAPSQFTVISYRGFSGWGTETLGPIMSHYRALCEVPGHIALVPRDRVGAVQDEDIARIFGQPCLSTGRTPQIAPGMR
jgi:hypothetical protein